MDLRDPVVDPEPAEDPEIATATEGWPVVDAVELEDPVI
jgi:hypothetical protein